MIVETGMLHGWCILKFSTLLKQMMEEHHLHVQVGWCADVSSQQARWVLTDFG